MNNDAASRVVRFGVFEMDLTARELRRSGVRVRLQDQPFRVLALLVERPGEIVTREQLRELLWAEDEFVEFDKSLNTAVQKIRQALGDSATSSRFLETIPRRGYRFVAPVEARQPTLEPNADPPPPRPKNWKRAFGAAAVVVIAVAVRIFWPDSEERLARPTYQINRLTLDSGLTIDPAISRDGSLAAYASDRSGKGDLDIWVQQVSGGGAVQLTDDATDDRAPDFSPDGGTIAFESSGDDQGIYVVSALGGAARLLASGGRLPRFSPDGRSIAYYRDNGVWVVSLDGGEPRPLSDELLAPGLNQSPPLWTDDGDHLIYTARLERSPGYDWWVVSVLEGDPVAMGAQTALGSQGLSRANAAGYQIPPGPDSWDQDGSIIFSAASGSTENLWRFRRPAADWRITGPAEQVTFGVAIERQAAIAADGTIVFSGLVERQNIWCAYGNPDAWVETDEIAALTSSPAADAQATVSADGTRIVFLSDRSGQNDVWYKDLSTGADAALTANPEMEAFPVISRDGSKAAFVVRTPGQANPVFVTDLDRGSPRKLCDDCAGAVRSWRFDASKLFFQAGPRSIFAMDPETGEHSEYLRSDDGLPAACRVSWDDRWLAFSQHGRSLYIVPLDESRPPARDQWIEVVEGTYRDDKPRWSPNGAFLYFTSSRDGFVCIWAQRLDPPTKQPIGEPYPIQHFHQAGRSMPRGSELAVARDKLVFDLTENTGNIWMLEPGGAE